MPDLKHFNGTFLIFRKLKRHHLSKSAGGQRLPYFRHATLEVAEAEARRLLTVFPESTFVIMQEVARLKAEPAAPALQEAE
jgi:hypothetical protein